MIHSGARYHNVLKRTFSNLLWRNYRIIIYHTNIAYMLVNKITKSIDQASKELYVSWANI